jgi:hypothetical protein
MDLSNMGQFGAFGAAVAREGDITLESVRKNWAILVACAVAIGAASVAREDIAALKRGQAEQKASYEATAHEVTRIGATLSRIEVEMRRMTREHRAIKQNFPEVLR